MSYNRLQIAGLGVPGGDTGTLLRLVQSHPAVVAPITSSRALAHAPVSDGAEAELEALQTAVPDMLAGVYLSHTFGQPQVAGRISEYLPAAKLLLVVRNPIDCLISAYEVARYKGRTKPNESCAEFVSRHAELQTAVRYSAGLEDLYGYYGPTSLHLVLYDELRDHPVKTLQGVFTFLEIDEKFVPPSIKHYYKSDEEPKHRAWWWRLVAWVLRPLTSRLKAKPQPLTPPRYDVAEYLSDEEYESLYAWYRDDLVVLSNYLDKDLVSAWDRSATTRAEA